MTYIWDSLDLILINNQYLRVHIRFGISIAPECEQLIGKESMPEPLKPLMQTTVASSNGHNRRSLMLELGIDTRGQWYPVERCAVKQYYCNIQWLYL